MPITATTLLISSLIATGVSTIVSVQQSRQEAKSTSAIAEYNAQRSRKQAAEEAEQLRIAGAAEQKEILEERRRVLARNRAKFGKAGVTMEGSPLLVQQEVARVITQDAVQANYNIQVGVAGTLTRGESEAGLSLLRGKSARRAGRLQVGQALFSGAAQATSIGLQFKAAQKKETA